MGFFDKIKSGMAKTRSALSNTLGSVFSGFSQIDDDFYDELEESLILADLGVETATKAADRLRKTVKEQHLKTPEDAKRCWKDHHHRQDRQRACVPRQKGVAGGG